MLQAGRTLAQAHIRARNAQFTRPLERLPAEVAWAAPFSRSSVLTTISAAIAPNRRFSLLSRPLGLAAELDVSARGASVASSAAGAFSAPARFMSVSPKKKARRAAERASQAAGAEAQHLTVALVGRPNVGKSSLFNKLVGRRLAIVDSTPGTTRDWKEAEGHIGSLRFTVMDTGGLEDEASKRRDGRPSRGDSPSDAIESKMLAHTAAAIAHADVVLFMVDAETGVTAEEVKFARWLKRLRASQGFGADSIALVVNKADKFGSFAFDGAAANAAALGRGGVAAVAGAGGDFHDADVEAALRAELSPKQRRKQAAAAAAAALVEADALSDDHAIDAFAADSWVDAAADSALEAAGDSGLSGRASAKAADGRLRWARLERDCFALGLGPPVPIAAESRIGFSDLHNVLYEAAVRRGSAPQRRGAAAIAAAEAPEQGVGSEAQARAGEAPAAGVPPVNGSSTAPAGEDMAVPEAVASVDSALADALSGFAGLDAGLAAEVQQLQDRAAAARREVAAGSTEAEAAPGADPAAASAPDVDVEAEADAAASDPAAAAALEARLDAEAAAAAVRPIQMAVVGRPNVGKSSLVNQLLGERRLLTGPTAGLTRDPTTVTLMAPPLRNRGEASAAGPDSGTGSGAAAAAAGAASAAAAAGAGGPGARQPVQIVDTAGMRRWGSWDLTTPLEGAAVGAAKRALQRANVVVLVVDASGGTKDSLTDVPQALLAAAAASSAAGRGGALGASLSSDAGSYASAPAPTGADGKRSKRGASPAVAGGASPTPSASASASTSTFTRGVRSSRELPGAGLTRQDLAIAEQVLEEGRGLVIVLNKVDTLAPGAALLAARAAARAAAEATAARAAAAGGHGDGSTSTSARDTSNGGSDSSSSAPQSELEVAASAVVRRAEAMLQLRQLAEADAKAAKAAAAAAAKDKAMTMARARGGAVVADAGAGANLRFNANADAGGEVDFGADVDVDVDVDGDVGSGPGTGSGHGQGSAASSVDPAMAAARAHASLLKHPNVVRVLTFVRSQLDAMHNGAGVEIVPVSSLTGAGRERVLPAVQRTYAHWNARVGTATLNRWLALIQRHHPPPATTVTLSSARPDEDGHRPTRRVPIRLKFLAQTGARPPTFTLYVNRAGPSGSSGGKGKGKGGSSGSSGALPESYARYLANALRREFSLGGVPVRLRIRAAVNPYKAKAAAQAAARRRRHAGLRAGGGGGPGRKRRLQLQRPRPRVRTPASASSAASSSSPSSSAASSSSAVRSGAGGRRSQPLRPSQLKRSAASRGAPGASPRTPTWGGNSSKVSGSGSGRDSSSSRGSDRSRAPAAGWQSKAKSKAKSEGSRRGGSSGGAGPGTPNSKKASFRQGRGAAVAARGARQQRGGGGRR